MPTYKQDTKATRGNSPINQVAGAASGFNPDQSMAGYIMQQGGGFSNMLDSMQNYRNQKKQALHASQGIANGNGMTAGMNPSTPTGTTGGLTQGASAGMTAGVGVQDDFQSTTEERLTALEGDGQGQVAQANVNNLESGATSNFIPQNQQEVVKSVVDGNKPSDRGIQQMMSPFKKTNNIQ